MKMFIKDRQSRGDEEKRISKCGIIYETRDPKSSSYRGPKSTCSFVEIYRRFRGAYCLRHQGDDLDEEGSNNFWNFGIFWRDYTTPYPRRLSSSISMMIVGSSGVLPLTPLPDQRSSPLSLLQNRYRELLPPVSAICLRGKVFRHSGNLTFSLCRSVS
jgi:hypothetical protein